MKEQLSKFTYTIEVTAPPHNKETAEQIWGEGAPCNPDFGVDCHAREILSELFKDAFIHRAQMEMKMMVSAEKAETEDSRERYEASAKDCGIKIKVYDGIQDSQTLLKEEKIK